MAEIIDLATTTNVETPYQPVSVARKIEPLESIEDNLDAEPKYPVMVVKASEVKLDNYAVVYGAFAPLTNELNGVAPVIAVPDNIIQFPGTENKPLLLDADQVLNLINKAAAASIPKLVAQAVEKANNYLELSEEEKRNAYFQTGGDVSKLSSNILMGGYDNGLSSATVDRILISNTADKISKSIEGLLRLENLQIFVEGKSYEVKLKESDIKVEDGKITITTISLEGDNEQKVFNNIVLEEDEGKFEIVNSSDMTKEEKSAIKNHINNQIAFQK